VPTAKVETRELVLAARRAMSSAARVEASSAVCRSVLSLPEAAAARSVAAYLSIGTEPSTDDLVEALRSKGVRVIVPVLRDDLDLDWAGYEGTGPLARSDRGLREPVGPRLGADAVGEVDLVVVPALAVGPGGLRLGRGGGSYDRALARVPPGRPVVALLYDDELLAAVPADPHDRRVTVAVTPRHVQRF
jgi:5-formyltetrahydrofolate cyclo-ligase